MSAGRLGIGLVGAGTAGPVLASALRAAGHEVVGVVARSADAIERADVMLPGVPVMEVEELLGVAELVILAVPDAQIEPLVAGLADLGAWRMGTIVVHLAAHLGAEVLAPARAVGAIPLAIHPLVRLTGWSADVGALSGAPFLVSAPGPFLPIAQALVVEMGGEPIVVDESERAAISAALSLGRTGIVSAVVRAHDALERAGIERPRELTRPLFLGSAEAALVEGVFALGAPLRTGDAEAVRAQAIALGGLDPAARDAYEAGARDAIGMLVEGGRLGERAADALLAALLEP